MCTAATLTTPGHAAWLLSLVLATWVLAGTCSREEPSSDCMAGGPGRTANRSRHTNWSCSPGLRPQQQCPCNPCTNENICTYDCKAAWHQKSQRASFEGDIHPGPRSVPGLLLPHKAPVLVTPPELLQEQHAIWGVINKPSTVHETVISARTGCVAARPSLCQLSRAAIQSQWAAPMWGLRHGLEPSQESRLRMLCASLEPSGRGHCLREGAPAGPHGPGF